jgi:hypothetical protein
VRSKKARSSSGANGSRSRGLSLATSIMSPTARGSSTSRSLSTTANRAWRQNTDPFVFGAQFHYTGCMQHTRRGPTQLRFLAPGSLVLFGSCREKARFVVDTAFVVGEFVDHSAQDWEQKLDGRISNTYRKVTVEPWYRRCSSSAWLPTVPGSSPQRHRAGCDRCTLYVRYSRIYPILRCCTPGRIQRERSGGVDQIG